MTETINDYLKILDQILNNIPKIENILIKELINTSYNLINSKNILVDIQYIDYIICHMLNKKYINYNKFLELGEKLENIVYSLKSKK